MFLHLVEVNIKVAIVANGSLLFDTLVDNFTFSGNQPPELLQVDEIVKLADFDKIDILLIDHPIDCKKIPAYKIRNIINLSGVPLFDREIALSKPYKLNDIATILCNNNTESGKLFVPINGKWIFNEQESKLQNADTSIKLTEKENNIIHFLFNSQDRSCNKEELFKSVWGYSASSETSTLETHLYKLRQKLPKDMLRIENNICSLHSACTKS